MAQAIFEPNLFPYKYPNILKPSHSSYLSAYEDGTDIVLRNVGIQNSDAGELPKRKHITFRTRRKLEIKNINVLRAWTVVIYKDLFRTSHKTP